MTRDCRVYLDDMIEAASKAIAYTSGLSYAEFVKDERTRDAVLFNLTTMGEAAQRVPDSMRSQYPDVGWEGISEFKSVVIGNDLRPDLETVWNIIQSQLPSLQEKIKRILADPFVIEHIDPSPAACPSTVARDEILRALEEHSETIRGFGVVSIGLFGSYVRGEETPESDIDILVEFEDPTYDKYFDLKVFLEGLLGRPVDLVFRNTLKPRLRPYILGEALYAAGF